MIKTDEPALFCDFAETYNIIGFRSLPARTAARLAAGLREDSRIRLKIGGVDDAPPLLFVQTMIFDVINRLLSFWSGAGGAPASLTDQIFNVKREEPQSEYEVFETGADFARRRKELIEG